MQIPNLIQIHFSLIFIYLVHGSNSEALPVGAPKTNSRDWEGRG